jgi:ubiquinol-cytochrome c reductase cytochrome b subunit
LIPLALLALAALHVAWVRRDGLAGRARRGEQRTKEEASGIPLFPDFAPRVALVMIAGLGALVGLVVFLPGAFFPPESFAPANPLDTPPNVKPEWYFLWRYELGRLVPEAVALLLQTLAMVALAALPFLDGGPRRHAFDRPLVIGGLLVAFAAWGTLTLLGMWA